MCCGVIFVFFFLSLTIFIFNMVSEPEKSLESWFLGYFSSVFCVVVANVFLLHCKLFAQGRLSYCHSPFPPLLSAQAMSSSPDRLQRSCPIRSRRHCAFHLSSGPCCMPRYRLCRFLQCATDCCRFLPCAASHHRCYSSVNQLLGGLTYWHRCSCGLLLQAAQCCRPLP